MEDLETTTIATPPVSPEPESVTPAPESAPEAEAPAPEVPELSLREKIQKKAEEVAARTPKRDQKTGKFEQKEPETLAKTDSPAPTLETPKVVVTGEKAPEKAAYTPNLKVKVMEQERDIPEWLKPLVKDAETEKQVKELVEKAYGLEYVKPKLEQERQKSQAFSTENTQIKSQIQEVRELYARGDIDGWLARLGVPEERMLQWMADKIRYEQLPDDQKAILDARKNAEERAWRAEQQTTSYQTQSEQLLTQQVQMALESVLARPDVSTVAQAFDDRMKTPGAFKSEIQRRGDYVWRTRNEIVPPEKLVQEMMALLGPVAPSTTPAPTTGAETPVAAAKAPQVIPAKTPPVIPNISGRSTSALKPKVKSIDDIKRIQKEMAAGQTR